MPAEKTVAVSFRVSPRFKTLLEAAAAKEHRSQTNMLEALLFQYCASNGVEVSQAELEPISESYAQAAAVCTGAPEERALAKDLSARRRTYRALGKAESDIKAGGQGA